MDSTLERFALRQIEMALGSNFVISSANESVVLEAAIRHQCVPFLQLFFEGNQIEFPRGLREWNRDAGARTLLYTFILRQIAADFDIPFAILKGIPLSEQLYGDTKWRQSTDIDLLINWEDLDYALNILEGLGFILERKIRPWAYNQIALRHKKHHATVELHWRLTLPYLPAPDTKALLENTHLFNSKSLGGQVPVLDKEATFFNLVMHFHQHFSFVKGAIDLVAWMRKNDPKKGIEYCSEFGLKSLSQLALATTIVRGFDFPFPQLRGSERRFLRKRVSIDSVFLEQADGAYMAYWKQVQNALFLDRENHRTEGFQKGILYGPHRFSDYFQQSEN